MSPATLHLFSVFNEITFWFTLLPIAVGIWRFKKCPFGFRIIIALAFISIATDTLTDIFRSDEDVSKYIPRVFTIVEFTLMSIFFIGEFARASMRYFVMVMNILFIGIAILDWSVNGAKQFDNLSTAIEAIIILFYCLMLFYFILRDMTYQNLLVTPQFWIVAGTMIYFGGSVFLFVFTNYMVAESMEALKAIWYGLHGTMLISYGTLISVGLWKVRPQYQ